MTEPVVPRRHPTNKGPLANWRGDLFGGVTAAIVALPLALAFGVASGLGVVAGLWGAVAIGFFAAAFGGTPAQVSGPTGPMTVVIAATAAQFADRPGIVFTIIMLAGLSQIAMGYLGIGRYIALMPYPVISGFMSGIGVIIILLQIAPLLGHANAGEGVLGAVAGFPEAVSAVRPDALAVGLLAIGIVFFWPARWSRIVPAPLAALALGTAAVLFWFEAAPVLGPIPTGLPQLRMPEVALSDLSTILQAALVLAALGAIDSLLTSLVADNLTETEHHPNKELKGQGIGNLVAGLVGGIPGAGATMRTVVNIRTGGRTRLSGMSHALVLLAIVLGLGPLASHIPHAVLAGILIKVGVDIIDWDGLKQLGRKPGEGTFFMLTVFLLTVFVDLITAVGVGVFLASLLFVHRMAEYQLSNIHKIVTAGDTGLSPEEAELLAGADRRIVLYRLSGPFSFGAAKGMVRKMTQGDDFDVLLLDFTEVPFLDSSAARALSDVVSRTKRAGKAVYFAGLEGKPRQVLADMGVLDLLPSANITESRHTALAAACGRQ